MIPELTPMKWFSVCSRSWPDLSGLNEDHIVSQRWRQSRAQAVLKKKIGSIWNITVDIDIIPLSMTWPALQEMEHAFLDSWSSCALFQSGDFQVELQRPPSSKVSWEETQDLILTLSCSSVSASVAAGKTWPPLYGPCVHRSDYPTWRKESGQPFPQRQPGILLVNLEMWLLSSWNSFSFVNVFILVLYLIGSKTSSV